MTILTASFLFLALAALGGVLITVRHVRGQELPHALAVGHPLLAGSALILLGAAYVRSGGDSTLAVALAVLVLAAAGGISLAVLRVKRGGAPLAFVAIHALVALTGSGLVLYEVVGGDPAVPPPFESEG